MIHKINSISQKKMYRILILSGIIFYVLFALIDGPYFTNDSPSYMNLEISREPLYSLFLALCRMLVPLQNDVYLYLAIILQGILMAVTSSVLARYVTEELSLCNLVSLGIYSFPYLVALLFRFVAGEPGEQFMYSNTILTEGVTVALHLLFVRYIFEYLRHQSKKSLIWSVVLCFIGINCRKQMIVWLMILLLVVLFCNIRERFVRNMVNCIAISVLVIFASLLFDRTVNFFANDQFSGHVNDNRFIATMIFYTSDLTDLECIEDEELRQLYKEIHESSKEQGLLKPSKESGMGWFDRSFHFVCSYDEIQIRTMYPMIREKMPEIEFASNINDSQQRLDAIVRYYIDACLLNNLPRMGSVYVDNVLTGFVATISQRNRLLSIYSIFMYIGYFASMGSLLIYGHKKGFSDELKGILTFASLCLLCILINVGVVGAVIFCQTRYVIYNMSVFYMAFLLMVQYIYRIVRGNIGEIND